MDKLLYKWVVHYTVCLSKVVYFELVFWFPGSIGCTLCKVKVGLGWGLLFSRVASDSRSAGMVAYEAMVRLFVVLWLFSLFCL